MRAGGCRSVRPPEADVLDCTWMAMRPEEAEPFALTLNRGASDSLRRDLPVASAVARSEVDVGYRNDPADQQAVAVERGRFPSVRERRVLVGVARMEMSEKALVVALRNARRPGHRGSLSHQTTATRRAPSVSTVGSQGFDSEI